MIHILYFFVALMLLQLDLPSQFSILPPRYFRRFLDLAELLSDVLVLPDVEKISFEQVVAVRIYEIDPVEN